MRAEDGAEPGRELQGGEINMVTANAPADVSKTTIGSRVRGRYVIANLPPGLYDVRVAPTIASGFAAVVQRNVQVQPGGAAVVDVVVGPRPWQACCRWCRTCSARACRKRWGGLPNGGLPWVRCWIPMGRKSRDDHD